ncbi:MAG: hypothetical protein V3V75_04415, partial [Thermoguttaceae bacterium]
RVIHSVPRNGCPREVATSSSAGCRRRVNMASGRLFDPPDHSIRRRPSAGRITKSERADNPLKV